MEFKVILTGNAPARGDLVLAAETPLSGVAFMAEVGNCLRKSIDHLARYRHITLGALATYEMNVPCNMAIESGLFDESSEVYITCENDLLSHYIFYSASVSQKSTGRPCYPYMHGESTLCSCIDELQFLSDWAELGYPSRVAWDGELVEWIQTSSNTSNRKPGVGCYGCTCFRECFGYNPPPPKKKHHKKDPPPPKEPDCCCPPPEPRPEPDRDHCTLCPPNMGHNSVPHKKNNDCLCDPPEEDDTCCHCFENTVPSPVKPGKQDRPGPMPPPHQCGPRPKKQRRRYDGVFMC